MDNAKAVEIFSKWLDCKDAYQADPSCDGRCYSCEYNTSAEDDKEAIQTAIAALKKLEAIQTCTPPSDDWEHYADRLHDIAYQSGYEQGKKDAGQWIPVTERLPEECEEVNITWVNTCPEPYYKDIKDKPFTGSGLYCKGRWYWYSAVCKDYLEEYGVSQGDDIDDDIIVTAWRSFPEPYKEDKA